MKRTAIAFLLLAAVTTVVLLVYRNWPNDRDHLVLGEAGIGDERTNRNPVLAKAIGDVDVIATLTPAFSEEVAVGIRRQSGVYRIFVVTNDLRVWPRLLEGKRLRDLGSANCDVAIPARLGQRLEAVWNAMLRQASPEPVSSGGFDNTHYNFSQTIDGKFVTANAWGADATTKVGQLQAIAFGMDAFCKTSDVRALSQLTARVNALATQLNLPPPERTP